VLSQHAADRGVMRASGSPAWASGEACITGTRAGGVARVVEVAETVESRAARGAVADAAGEVVATAGVPGAAALAAPAAAPRELPCPATSSISAISTLYGPSAPLRRGSCSARRRRATDLGVDLVGDDSSSGSSWRRCHRVLEPLPDRPLGHALAELGHRHLGHVSLLLRGLPDDGLAAVAASLPSGVNRASCAIHSPLSGLRARCRRPGFAAAPATAAPGCCGSGLLRPVAHLRPGEARQPVPDSVV